MFFFPSSAILEIGSSHLVCDSSQNGYVFDQSSFHLIMWSYDYNCLIFYSHLAVS